MRDTLGLGGVIPEDWYEVQRPRAERRSYQGLWFCSADCMLAGAVREYTRASGGVLDWQHVPMSTPHSPIVHAVPLGLHRDHSDGLTMSACSLVRLHQLVPASGDQLRPCKRCAAIVERLEPGVWFTQEVGA
jgi:hypothetical protein